MNVLDSFTPPLSLTKGSKIGIRVGSFCVSLIAWRISGWVMDYQNVPVLNTTNFTEWRDKVETWLLAYQHEVWKLVCDGYCTDSPTVKEQQRNAKAKCVIYNSLHNKDLELIMDLTSTKEIWDRLHFMHGVDTKECTVKKERRIKKKKNSCQ